MTEFHSDNYMLSVDHALERVLKNIPLLSSERCSLEETEGRVLSQDVVASVNQPPTDVSAMDGYAFRFEDLIGGPEKTVLKVIGEAPAGKPFPRKVGKGEVVRIFTGACLPQGADTVVIQENVKANDGYIEIQLNPLRGKNIRALGSDFKKTDVLLEKGKKISARDIGLIAAGNNSHIEVTKKPKVAILSTGDELRFAGEVTSTSEIVNSNAPMLKSLIEKIGGEAILLGIAKDNEQSVIEKAGRAKDADMLVTIGGASVGDYDIVTSTLEKLGFKLDFWKVAMRPGKPVIFGDLYGPVLGLPGNPVSAMVGAVLFLAPILERFLGQAEGNFKEINARLGEDLGENNNRKAYLRSSIEYSKDGTLIVKTLNTQDSAALKSFSQSGCLLVRDVNSPASKEGDLCKIIPLTPI